MARGSSNDGIPARVRLAMLSEGIGPEDANFPVDFARPVGIPDYWTYSRARPLAVGAKDAEVCQMWFHGHGCRDWLACTNGEHPRWVWKPEHNDKHLGNIVKVPEGWHDLLDLNFCRKKPEVPRHTGLLLGQVLQGRHGTVKPDGMPPPARVYTVLQR